MMIRHRNRDEGLGLIELIVAIVVSGILFIGIATVFTRSWQTQEEVMSVSEATNRGQLVASAVERAVRNGLYVEVSADGTTLRVSTSLSGSLKCQAFLLADTSGGIARFSASSGPLGDSSTWPTWQTGVAADGATPFFDDSTPGVIRYGFQLDTDSAPVRFAGEVAPRSVQDATNGGCW